MCFFHFQAKAIKSCEVTCVFGILEYANAFGDLFLYQIRNLQLWYCKCRNYLRTNFTTRIEIYTVIYVKNAPQYCFCSPPCPTHPNAPLPHPASKVSRVSVPRHLTNMSSSIAENIGKMSQFSQTAYICLPPYLCTILFMFKR